MKKFIAVAAAVAALTLTACQPATLTRVSDSVPVQAQSSTVQAPISVPSTAPAPKVEKTTVTTAPAPVIAAPAKVAPAPVQAVQAAPAPIAEPAPELVNGVNPECAEQSMQTAPNGSCLPTACPVAGQTMDIEGNCTGPAPKAVAPAPVRPTLKGIAPKVNPAIPPHAEPAPVKKSGANSSNTCTEIFYFNPEDDPCKSR